MNPHKINRDNFLNCMSYGVAIITSSTYKTRSNDTDYPYRADSNFWYLSGFEEDNSTLVFIKTKKKSRVILFVQKRDKTQELWNGERLGVKRAKKKFDVDKTYSIDKLQNKLAEYLKDSHRLYLDLYSQNSRLLEIKKVAKKSKVNRLTNIIPIVQKLRLIKSEHEITLIKRAIEITKKAHHSAMKKASSKLHEYQLQADIEHTFKSNGAYSDAYTSIVAGGNSANTLHYITNANKLCDGELVLIDAGCEYKMYASDITRTFPVNGKFSSAQSELYELVLHTQEEVIKAIKPNVTKVILQDLSVKLLTKGMIALGILKGDLEELIKKDKYKKYYPHGIGHWMGIDVHDPCPYKDKKNRDIVFKEGMVLTIEPALYVEKNDKKVPLKYRGIGIRIEDNILVTKKGYENLSESIVKSVEDVEQMCRAI
ncbi:MAG: M24 family metallopeptidase [Helicobacteraceae bacterium]|nr:M24 family metallopeptidase [Helicobacteraceae bacterium]